MGGHLSKSKTALQGGSLTANGFEEDLVYHRLSAGCAVFMEGHLSKSKRVFRRVVASSRNQGVVADSIESFLNYSECEIITVAGLAFRDIDWLISRANHEVFHRSYLIPSSSSLNYIWHLKLALSSINIITLSRRNLHSSNKAVWNPSLALVQ